jgi:hypothetical protein
MLPYRNVYREIDLVSLLVVHTLVCGLARSVDRSSRPVVPYKDSLFCMLNTLSALSRKQRTSRFVS